MSESLEQYSGKWTFFVNTNRLLFLLVVSTVLLVYYFVGGYGFPDYRNYIALAENNGYITSANEYAAEWVARFFLRNGFGVADSAAGTVDFFAAFVQIFYIVFILILMRGDDLQQQQRGWLFFTLALSPLLLTTALRATPAYLIIAYLCSYGKISTFRFFILAVVAISFHDSAIVMIALYVMSCVFCNVFYNVRESFLRWGMWGAFTLILLSQQVSFLFVSLVSHFDLGIRAVYFQGGESASVVKKIFLLFIWVVAYTGLSGEAVSIRSKVFLCASTLVMALSFSLSEVAGIRFSVYVLGAAVVAKGAFLFSGNEDSKFKQVDLVLGFMYFVIMFYDIFRNVKAS
ncbi:hypothetical protein [Pseudomonas versuta]|uniref:EpsG family protein n=1 Tax=Pseudomonas versuta TaxID=1788301 RepID=A0ABX3E7M4_9PSED|nr:hypothetical protein [Pseudomonas versuta]ALE87598.1 hypothetical protein AOC04_04895 [Pseudomonas versuta]OKA20316.1 hypothetical protein BOH73_14915 [Pseudomonas versuta]